MPSVTGGPSDLGGNIPYSPPPGESGECDFVQLLASDIEEGARFIGFFQLGLVGELASGSVFLATWPDFQVYRMPEVDLDFTFMSYTAGYALACAPDRCALFSVPVASGFFERVPGGSVPGGAGYTSLRWEDYLLCVSGEGETDVCFDRVRWTFRDGGGATLPDAGIDASRRYDGGVLDTVGDANPWAAECDAPIYCDDPELADDPFCLYDLVDSFGYISGVTRAGRMIKGDYDGSGVARCVTVSPPFGPPIGLASSTCGIVDHVVMLTAEGMYETCGCALD